MDPTLVSFLTTLATEVTTGVAKDTAKAIWSQAKFLLGLSEHEAQVPAKVEAALAARPDAAPELAALRRAYQNSLVVNAKNVGAINVAGDQNNNFN
jgi:hypothetical protein